MKLRTGIWDFMGNTVEYHGGDSGYDLDSREEIPVDMLLAMGEFIKDFD